MLLPQKAETFFTFARLKYRIALDRSPAGVYNAKAVRPRTGR